MSKTVAQLPAASALSGAELVHLVQGGNSRRSTVDAVAARALTAPAGINTINPKTTLDVNGSVLVRSGSRMVFNDYTSSSDHGPWIAYSAAADTLDIVSGFNPTANSMGAGGIRFGLGSGASWSGRLNITNSTFEPNNNNFMDLGTSSSRFKDAFLVNSPSVSSDERLKDWKRTSLSEAEIAAGEEIIGESGFYQWLDMIAEKGVEHARWHFGSKAQDVVRIFANHGVEDIDPALLDIEPDVFVAEVDRPSMRQAFLTFDTWDDQYEPEYETVTVSHETEDGIVEELVEQPTGNMILVRPAGNVFGFRVEELHMFLTRVVYELGKRRDARMDALELRIAALEGA